MLAGLGKEFIAKLGRGLVLRLLAYSLFLLGFWLLFQAFERSNVLLGVGGGAVVLVAMWAMVGFRRTPSFKPGAQNDSERRPPGDGYDR